MSEENNNKKVSFYEAVAEQHSEATVRKVKNIFWWYDIFSFALSFQLIYICTKLLPIKFSATMLSVIFILITDTLVKTTLTKDNEGYEKLQKQMGFVKLLTVPLMFVGVGVIAYAILNIAGVI